MRRLKMAGSCGAIGIDGSSSAQARGSRHFRCLVVRCERVITTDAGFFHRACALLTWRRVLK
jgi:hypothetical protein